MDIYKCAWNNRVSHIEALNRTDAENKFEEKYGFFPSDDIVSITKTHMRAI